jgi:Transposase DDE domain group 1
MIRGMMKTRRRSPTENPLPFQLDPEPATEKLTGYGGAPLIVQTFRSLGLPKAVQQEVQIKERERGFDEATFVESFVILNAVGGECLEDFEQLRADPGLAELIGHGIPSPEAARKFLYAFHDEKKIEEAQQLKRGGAACIVGESRPLAGLQSVNRRLIAGVGAGAQNQKIGTVDADATIIESDKREAKMTFEGAHGYQPMLAVWAETGLILADEFRDGNVPAHYQPLNVVKAGFQALPATVNEYYFRGDSACHEYELIQWLEDEQREDGPQGFIGFAISMRVHASLKNAMQAIPASEWEQISDEGNALRSCAEVAYVPGYGFESKNRLPLRYIAIRIQSKQGHLLNGDEVKYFAVVTNITDWAGRRLVQWHREKAGTVEQVNDILKNELAAGVLPCGRFGANAAWLRLAVLSHNVLTALKRLALPVDHLWARPKRLRFLFFNLPGRVIQHARTMYLRLGTLLARIDEYQQVLHALPVPV